MESYILIYLLCWFFTNFEPIQELVDYLFGKLKHNYFINAIWTILGCQYCLTLWITLILTGSITVALIASIIAQIHKSLIGEC